MGKITIERMRELAAAKGGKCLSEVYVNSASKLQWQCARGHTWWIAANSIKAGTWCLKCYQESQLLTIEKMQELAAAKGGKCLSGTYKNNTTKLQWQCEKGHTWLTTPSSVKHSGTWCPKCTLNGRPKDNIENMQQLAITNGGKCLSAKYKGARVPLLWECALGHQWKAIPDNIKNKKSWCPTCAHAQVRGFIYTIDDMQQSAAAIGGKCLSDTYEGDRTKLRWQCNKGHTWLAMPHNVKTNGTWCPYCAETTRLTLKQMRALAAKHKCKCLSKVYVNIRIPLKWTCKKGHVWRASYMYVKSRINFCPRCQAIKMRAKKRNLINAIRARKRLRKQRWKQKQKRRY